ncbi:hypothetical protein J2X11_001505 [Aeromicrobium panaciterrae]|uniref:PKD domain-containing protein n=1 Tax=Aeromicrobium panaciterrae TaxID=363861 RepID=A0ABU1UNB5_9ACTN|nr:hypothetical protein [Aeromicrobium panaciterrae]MDR7086666.1 hypothetical protein [Aeromicrobium panaciterrae]
MIRPAIVLLSSLLFLGTNCPSSFAGVDVTPKPKDARIQLDAGRESPGSKHSFDRVFGKRADGPKFIQVACRTDEENLTFGCRAIQPVDPDGPELTEGAILRAARELGLPSLEVQIQPGASTLVNVPTIFYAEPEAFNRSVTLLGFDIDLIATPIRYRWLHGDGTASTTAKPGKPYPSTDVTYRYRQPAEAISPRVDVTYRVRYRVDGGSWNTIDQTLLASGPTTSLEVKEAAPVLTHP